MERITAAELIPMISGSPAAPISDNGCLFLKNGFCSSCTCDKCHNGYILDDMRKDWTAAPKECTCRRDALNRKHIRESGLAPLVDRYTFERYTTPRPWQVAIKKKALSYLKTWRESSFFVGGQSGSGKTHICTAICTGIMHDGGSLRYMQWVRDATRIKQLVTEPEAYEAEIKPLLKADALYLDDVFKTTPTDADIRLLYEIINGRYIQGKPVIISSERGLKWIRKFRDCEAIAGRIAEMVGEYYLEISGPEKNWRLPG